MLPVLLGMNNPHTADPRWALAPHPSGVAGHRLYEMLRDVRPETTRAEYMRGFDRRNVLDQTTWSLERARERAESLWRDLRGRRVLVLGADAGNLLRLSRTPVLLWRELEGVTYCCAPHPSGRCREYNDELMRTAVGLRLESMLLSDHEV